MCILCGWLSIYADMYVLYLCAHPMCVCGLEPREGQWKAIWAQTGHAASHSVWWSCCCAQVHRHRGPVQRKVGHRQAMHPVTVCDGHVVVPKCTGTKGQCKGRLGTGRHAPSHSVWWSCCCAQVHRHRWPVQSKVGHRQALHPVTVCDGHVVVPKCTGTEGQCKGRLGTGRPCTQSQCVMVMLLCPSAQAQRASAKEGWAQAGHAASHSVWWSCCCAQVHRHRGPVQSKVGHRQACTQSQCVMVMLLCPSAQAQRASAKEGWAQAGHAPSHSVWWSCCCAQVHRHRGQVQRKVGHRQAMHPVTVCDGHVVVPKCTGTEGQCKARLGTGRPCTQSQCVMVMLLCPSAQAQRGSAKQGWAQPWQTTRPHKPSAHIGGHVCRHTKAPQPPERERERYIYIYRYIPRNLVHMHQHNEQCLLCIKTCFSDGLTMLNSCET